MNQFAKKFAISLAALSLCTCAFMGCDSDDDKSGSQGGSQNGNSGSVASGTVQKGGDCMYTSDCVDGLVCDDDHKCADSNTSAKDPCAGITCTEGSCILGICVTDTMKAFQAKDGCNVESFQDFCLDNKAVQCIDNQVFVDDCAAQKAGACTVAASNSSKYAFCGGNEDMLAKCQANESGAKKANIHLCYGEENWAADFMCVVDLSNKLVAMPKGSNDAFFLECNDKACQYDENGEPKCAE